MARPQNRTLWLIQQRERFDKNASLQFRIIGAAKRKSVCVRNEQCARRPNLFRDFAQKHEAHRRDSTAFDCGGDQTHGLIAHRSYGDEDHGINGVLHERIRDLRSASLDQPAGRRDRAHE